MSNRVTRRGHEPTPRMLYLDFVGKTRLFEVADDWICEPCGRLRINSWNACVQQMEGRR